MTVLADKVTEFGKDNLEDVYNSVKTLSEFSFFNYVGISDSEGNAVDSGGNRANISQRKYFQEAMNGKAVSISDVLTSNVIDGDDVQIMAVPVIRDGTPVGVV